MADVLWLSAGWVLFSMVLLWGLSLALRDAGIVDIWWGPGFGAIALLVYLQAAPGGGRPLLLLCLVLLAGLRLGTHLLLRNTRKGEEDPRYQAMRRYWGAERFPWISLLTVFGLQGVLMWLVSLPLQVGIALDRGAALGALDYIALLLFAVGFAFESIGDVQLTRFRARPESAGRVLDSGLWRYTRHPNYFGNALMHWAFFLLALAGAGRAALPALLSPLLMTFLLLRVSGVAMLERSMHKRRPGYPDYQQRTSAFVPLPPRHGPVGPGAPQP